MNWYQNRRLKLAQPNPWAKGDGGYYRAALLSGSPGVGKKLINVTFSLTIVFVGCRMNCINLCTGKTTTVSVVCKELGFDTVEFNASDTRSKNLIKEKIAELTCTNSLAGFVKGAF